MVTLYRHGDQNGIFLAKETNIIQFWISSYQPVPYSKYKTQVHTVYLVQQQ